MTNRRSRVLVGFFVAMLVFVSLAMGAPPHDVALAAPGISGGLQQAIDAADAGGIVMLSPGTYRENVRIEKPITLIGGEGVFLEPADVSAPVIAVDQTDGVVIQGIAIRMAAVGIDLSLGSCAMSDCVISASEKGIHAILFDNNLEITSSTVQSSDQGVGVTILGSGSVHLALCEFRGLATGLNVGGTLEVTAVRCAFERCFDAIVALDTSETVLVENRIAGNFGNGIRFAHAPASAEEGFLMMLRNTIENSGGAGLSLCSLSGDAPADPFGTILGTGNTFSGNGLGSTCPSDLVLPEGFTTP